MAACCVCRLLAARRRRPARARAEADRRHLGRPTVVRSVRRISAAVARRVGAAGAAGRSIRNGYQGHAATETCPGHSTILTGSAAGAQRDHRQHLGRPVGRRAPTRRSIAPRTSASRARRRPPTRCRHAHLKVPTLGEHAEARSRPASRNVAVAGKDRAAVMMSGQRPDQRWYWDGKTFVTDLKGAAVPQSVTVGQRRGRGAGGAGAAAARPAGIVRGQGARRCRSAAAASRSAPGGSARAAGDLTPVPRFARIRRRDAGAGRRRWCAK